MDGEVTFSNPSFRNTLWTMRNEFNDATLICNGRKSKFGCHKIVLASVSGIFRDMLRKSNEIDLGEVSNEDCHRFLKFIYLGKIKMRKLDQDRMTELGKRFAVKGLQRARTASSSSSSSSSSESNSSDCDVDANKSIFDLPAELLINILVRLPTHDLLVNVAAVSKYFYQLAKDPMVHVKVFLPANIDLGPAVNFLRKASQIQQLKIFTYDDTELQLRPKPFSGEAVQQVFCDELLIAVSSHPNLRVVDVNGLRASATAFNPLSMTKFFTNLENLSLHIEMTSGTIDKLHLELTFAIMASIGKLKRIKLRGVSSMDANHLTSLAISCKQLKCFTSDCPLSNSQQVSIYKARRDTLKHFDVDSISWDDEIFESLSQCQKIDKLTEYIYPFFAGINKLKNLRAIHIEFDPNQSLEVLRETFTDNALPRIESIGITTVCNERKIYPLIARACPNVKVLYMCSTNENIELETLQKMIYRYSKLEIVITNMTLSWLRFNVSDLFTDAADKLKKLEYVGFDFGNSPRSEARRLFENIPSLICASYKRHLYVKSTETIESVISFEKHFEFFNKISILHLRK